MLQKLIALVLAILLANTAKAQASYTIVVNQAANVYIHDSGNTKLELLENNKPKYSTTSKITGNLISITENAGVDAHVYLPIAQISSIKNNNSAFVSCDATVRSENLNLEQNGSGFIALDLNTRNLNVINNGSGDIRLSGEANNSVYNNSGSGTIDAQKLAAHNIAANIQGSGDIKINPLGQVSVNKNGSGNIVDQNNPDQSVYSEEEEEKIVKNSDGTVDTIKIKIGKRNVIILDKDKNVSIDNDSISAPKKYKGRIDFAGIEIGLHSWRNNDFDEVDSTYHKNSNALKSNTVNVNIFEAKLLGNRKARIVTGLGFSFNYYRFEPKWRPIPQKTAFAMEYIDTTTAVVKRKLVTSSIAVPLMVQVSTAKSKNSLRLSAGVIGYYRFVAALKEKISGDRSEKQTTRDEFNLRKFRYDATVRLGIRNIYVFANYGLSSIFNDNQNADIRPLTVGISILGL